MNIREYREYIHEISTHTCIHEYSREKRRELNVNEREHTGEGFPTKDGKVNELKPARIHSHSVHKQIGEGLITLLFFIFFAFVVY